MMRQEIRYYTQTGHTKMLADAAAEVLGIEAATIDTPITEHVDVLFFGSAVYAAMVDAKVKQFIESLDPALIGRVVCFSSAALLPGNYRQVKRLFEAKGIEVDAREFHCKGAFMALHKGRPNQEDVNNFKNWLKSL